jgi:hypothetical protein
MRIALNSPNLLFALPWAQLDTTTNSLSPPERGEASRVAELYAGRGEGI